MAPDLFAIKGHLEKRKEFSEIGNYKISISLQSSVDRIPISHCGAQFSINDPAIELWLTFSQIVWENLPKHITWTCKIVD